jgi:hypothetical protein
MARTVTEIRSLARSYTRTALHVLVGVMRSKDATAAAKVSAANSILDRGWGKATQPVGNDDDGALELVRARHARGLHSRSAERWRNRASA